MIIFPASSERPDDYPEGLPFVPGALVEITQFPDAVVMKWFGVERAFDVVQQVVGASAQDGWRTVDPGRPAQPGPAMSRRVMGRDGMRRDIEVLHAGPFTSVVLRQHRPRPAHSPGAWSVLLALFLTACGGGDTVDQWEPAAVRAVARHVQAQHAGERVQVSPTARGQELPWGVRQALTTGGIELADAASPAPGVVLLEFVRFAADNGGWQVETRTTRGAGAATSDVWAVRCLTEPCEVHPGRTAPGDTIEESP